MSDELKALLAKATPGPWKWQGEDYRGGWGWQLLVGPDGSGVICGGRGKTPFEGLRAHIPVDPALCKTGFYATDKSAPPVHVREPDAALIVAAVNALPGLLAENEALRAKLADAERERRALWSAIIPPGPRCRDCADFDGRCQGDGHPCEPQERALEIVARMKAAERRLLPEKLTEEQREKLHLALAQWTGAGYPSEEDVDRLLAILTRIEGEK